MSEVESGDAGLVEARTTPSIYISTLNFGPADAASESFQAEICQGKILGGPEQGADTMSHTPLGQCPVCL